MGLNKIDLNSHVKESTCKGLIFRAHINPYISSHKSFEVRKSLRLLKRKSCSGCKDCEWVWDNIQEDIFDAGNIDILDDIDKDGKLYKLKWKWSPGPYEYPDDGEMEFSFERWEGLEKH
jgi:hypothetical protein